MLWWTLRQLKNGGWEAREAAARRLAAADDPRVVPALIDALRDDDCRVAEAAAAGLGTRVCTDSYEALMAALRRSTNSRVRCAAARALGGRGTRDAIELLVKLVADRDPSVRQSASEALARLDPDWMRGKEAAAAVPALIDILSGERSPDDVIVPAARALGGIGDPSAAPPLIDRLRHYDGAVHSAVLSALELLDPAWRQSFGAKAVPRLLTSGIGAKRALDAIDPIWADSAAVRAAIPDLIVSQHRGYASGGDALRMIAAASKELPAGIDALKDGRAIASAVGLALLPALVQQLRSGSGWKGRDAAEAIRFLGQDASTALPMLAEALEDPDPEVRRRAIEVIAGFGPAAHHLAP